MSNINLLEIEPDELFRQYSITEIIRIQQNIQNDIDKKKVLLQTMVGERYRDVITASDTIQNMQEISSKLLDDVNDVVELFKNFNSSTFEIEDTKISEKEKGYVQEKSILFQIKILIFIPEMIWTALDDKQFLKSVQLFLFAQHIYTGLQFDSSLDIDKKYPIINMQWKKIHNLQKRIVDSSLEELQEHSITFQRASDCLASQALLSRATSHELLEQFGELRKWCLLQTVQGAHSSVRAQTSAALKCVLDTAALMDECFGADGGVVERLDSVEKQRVLDVLEIDGLDVSILPPIIKDYRPSSVVPFVPIDQTEMASAVSSWLSWVEESIEADMKNLLNLVTSIRALDNIRDEALKTESSSSWSRLRSRLRLPRDLSAWRAVLGTAVNDRVRGVVSARVTDAVDSAASEAGEALARAGRGDSARPELDLRWHVWRDEIEDHQSLLNNTATPSHSLTAQSRGYSPTIVKLCVSLDTRLASLLQELRMHGGRDDVRVHLQSVVCTEINRLVKMLERQANVKENTTSVNEETTRHIMCARLLQALTELCPACERASGASAWPSVRQALLDASAAAWMRWLELQTPKFAQIIDQGLEIGVGLRESLQWMPQWSTVEIEEQHEDSAIKSQIRIPSQPNLYLQDTLFHICKKLNSVIPHTIHRQVRHKLIEYVTERVLQVYETLSGNEALIQSQAMQFLFDVKYIATILIKNTRTESICDRLKAKIDPFDYKVSYPHLQNGIASSVQRTQMLLSALVPDRVSVTVRKDANVTACIAVAESAAGVMFPLLPVATPAGNRTHARAQAARSSPQHSTGREHGTVVNVKSTAASFLSDWFG